MPAPTTPTARQVAATGAPASAVHALDLATFDEVVATADRLLIVDFWAAWCSPCAPMGVVLAEVARMHGDVLSVGTVDIDAHPDLARRFDVMSAPTLLVFASGHLVDRLVGARSRTRILEDLDRHLA